MTKRPSAGKLWTMKKADLAAYIHDLENEVWPGHGHLGGMEQRTRANLIEVALLYHRIEAEGIGPNLRKE